MLDHTRTAPVHNRGQPPCEQVGKPVCPDAAARVRRASTRRQPLLAFDGWEHAWYLQYKNVKAEFFEALWNIVNWPDVAARYAVARGVSIS